MWGERLGGVGHLGLTGGGVDTWVRGGVGGMGYLLRGVRLVGVWDTWV